MTVHVPASVAAGTIDRDISIASLFKRAKKLEKNYATRLRQIARHVGHIATGFDIESTNGSTLLQAALRRYADALEPWAKAVGQRMVTEVAAADRESWRKTSATIGRLLHKEIQTAPTGRAMQDALTRQVDLITSLPRDAADRVHKLTTEGMAQGRRTAAIAAEIARTGEVTRSRADLIARTEVSRTATELTKARAAHVGSTHFIWRAHHDDSTRPTHRALDGQAFRWDEPPECDPGHHALPGGIWNCRCFPEPVLSSD